MTKMLSDDLRRRGGYPADPQRSREKLFFFFFPRLDPQIRGSRILPELVCDVTKRRITAKVMWASVILRFTFHLIWVSMTARSIHHKWIHFSFLFFFATWSKQFKRAKDFCSGQCQKPKSPREREKRGKGGFVGISQAAIRVCCVRSSSWRMVSRLSRTAPLLSALLSCAAALRLRSTSVASSLRRHVKPPSSLKSKRGQTHPLIHCPSTPPPNPLLRAVSQRVDRERGKSEESTPPQPRCHWQEKSSESFDAYFCCALRCSSWDLEREKQTGILRFSCVLHAWNIGINMMNPLNWL